MVLPDFSEEMTSSRVKTVSRKPTIAEGSHTERGVSDKLMDTEDSSLTEEFSQVTALTVSCTDLVIGS